ncbi:MAG: thioredoxin-dependent thiol peroxidase [Dongiaceae bacterium]
MALQNGQPAPNFSLTADDGGTISLRDFRGKKVVLYFYPKDDTPGCTTEACNFRDSIERLQEANAEVIGISRDSTASHARFKEKYDLNFPLLSDEDGSVCESYGVWITKNMYGKAYMGIQRSTFLVDEKGNIEQAWYGVSVPGHVEEILSILEGTSLPQAANSNKPPLKKTKTKKKPAKKSKARAKTSKKKTPAKKNKSKRSKKSGPKGKARGRAA